MRMKTNVAIAPKLYGLPKIHKENVPLRPICSYVSSPCYELCKYITNILKNITIDSKYNIKNSIDFKEKIRNIKLDNNERLISLDVVSLFPSTPINLALNIIEENWDRIERFTTISRHFFLEIVKFCLIDNRYFQYNDKIFIQKEGLPMGSPASPIVADIVMEKLLDDCIEKLNMKPKIITKYVDDLFCIVQESEIENILNTFNSYHPNIKFTIERESNFKLPYLDTLLIRNKNNLLIDWYRKPTSSGRIINYFSKHPKSMIINTAKNLIKRVLSISDTKFHRKNKKIIKNILIDNNFPNNIACKLINQFKMINKKSINTSEDKIYKSFPYVPGFSDRFQKSNIYDGNKYRIAHKIFNTVGRLFSKPKDKTKKLDNHNVVYKIPCGGNDTENCNKFYIGTTKNKLKTRLAGHKSDQKNKNNLSTQKTALSTHCFNSNHYPDFENTSILNIEDNYKRRYILEMLQIMKVPERFRINFKTDIDNVAQCYRYLITKNRKRKS